MIDVFTAKRIFPHCPFESNQTLTKISVLTLRCAIWFCGVMHIAELDSMVGCTLWSGVFKKEILITWLCGVMHTPELHSMLVCSVHTSQLDSMVGYTPYAWHHGVKLLWKCPFSFSYLLHLSKTFDWITICDLCYYFNIFILISWGITEK